MKESIGVVLAAVIALPVGSGWAAQAATAESSSGTTYYVDCAHGSDSNLGTSPGRAWESLNRASAVTYRPGDRVLLRRGTACDGVFAPHGSGTPGEPITVGAYGRGGKPQINGEGARAAVFLDNVQGWELHDLDITDTGAPTTTDRRAGVLVLLTDYGIGEHYVVDDVSVHDVNGADFKDPDPSGGILFAVQGSAKPTAFADVTVEDSSVGNVDRTGIGTSSTWGKRPQYPGGPGTSFAPITGLTIRDNQVSDVGGDGIVVQNAVGAHVEHNRVAGFNERSAGYNAGVWAWNSDQVLYEYNDVSGGHGTRDSMAYDIDGGNNGNVYQYNYSHANDGGFLLICNGGGMTSSDNTVRYNVSIDDRQSSATRGVISILCAATTGTQVYGNTVVSGGPATALVYNAGNTGVTFHDNILAGPAAGAPINDTLSTYDHNLYDNTGALPSSDTAPIEGTPDFLTPEPATPEQVRLRIGSPAIGTGTPVQGDVSHDLFGDPIANPPNIGAYTGPGVG